MMTIHQKSFKKYVHFNAKLVKQKLIIVQNVNQDYIETKKHQTVIVYKVTMIINKQQITALNAQIHAKHGKNNI